MRSILRLLVAWTSVAVFAAFGSGWLSDLSSPVWATGFFLWLFLVIMWSAFGVVHEAEDLAHRLGEPLGTLILTLSIVIIEVVLVSAVMLSAKKAPTLGRDTMFAVLMIVLNGVVGLGLLIGGLRHHQQRYNLKGAAAFLSVIIPLTVIALIIPNFTTSTTNGTLTPFQAISFSIFTIALYGVFLMIQTNRHRSFFLEAEVEEGDATGSGTGDASAKAVLGHTGLLLANILPIVLLSKSLATVLDHGIAALGAPGARRRSDRGHRVHSGGNQRAQGRLAQRAAAGDQSLPRSGNLDGGAHGARYPRGGALHPAIRHSRACPDRDDAARGHADPEYPDVFRHAHHRPGRRRASGPILRLPDADLQPMR